MMPAAPLSLRLAVRRALVIVETDYVAEHYDLPLSTRQREGIGWGRAGVLDPASYDLIADSVTEAIEREGIITPQWTFFPKGARLEGITVTHDQSEAEEIIQSRSFGFVEFRLLGCYCGWEGEWEEGEPKDTVPRDYPHYDAEALIREVIAPAVVAPFSERSVVSDYALDLAISIWHSFGSLTPLSFETTLASGVVTRDKREVQRLLRAGDRVISNRSFPCVSAADAQPTMMEG